MKNIIYSVIGVLVVLGIVGAYFFPQVTMIETVKGVSSVGVTSESAKFSGITWSLTSNSATSTSLYNSGSDRAIQSITVNCTSVGTSQTPLTGAGLATLTFTAATTSTSAPYNISNTNTLLTAAVISTSTPWTYLSTTTPGLSATSGKDFVRIWPASTYLTFASNATNTAQCLVGANYVSL